jgi:hypothetical protein
MRTYLLVFDDGSDPEIDLRRFVDTLDAGAEVLTLDGHVCFLKSDFSARKLCDKFLGFAGSRVFFITELNSTNYSGRMQGPYWDFIKRQEKLSAAE